MPTVVTVTVGPTGRDYTTLKNAIDSEVKNLVTADEQLVFECDDFEDTALNTEVTGAYTTDATRNIVIRPASGVSHGGDPTQGYRINISDGDPALSLRIEFTVVEGITLIQRSFSHAIEIAAANCTVQDCLLVGESNGNVVEINDNNAKIYNCLIKADGGFACFLSGDNADIRNVSVMNTGTPTGSGFRSFSTSDDHTFINCVAFGFDNDWDLDGGTTILEASGNAGGTGTSTGLGVDYRVIDSTAFVNFASEDYTPASGGLLNAQGSNQRSLFINDVTGETRAYWDIGAFAAGAFLDTEVQQLLSNPAQIDGDLTGYVAYADASLMGPTFWDSITLAADIEYIGAVAGNATTSLDISGLSLLPGDILIYTGSEDTGAPPQPTGYTEILNIDVNSIEMYAGYKVVGDPVDTTVSLPSAANSAAVSVWRGVDPDAISFSSTIAGTDPPSVEALTAGSAAIVIACLDDDPATISTTPAGYTVAATGSGSGGSIAQLYKSDLAVGTEDPGSVDWTQPDAENVTTLLLGKGAGSNGSDIRVFSSDGAVEYPLDVVNILLTEEGRFYFKITDVLDDTVAQTISVHANGLALGYADDDDYGRYACWSDYDIVWHGDIETVESSAGRTITEDGTVAYSTDSPFSSGQSLATDGGLLIQLGSTYADLYPFTMQAFVKSDGTREQTLISVADGDSSNDNEARVSADDDTTYIMRARGGVFSAETTNSTAGDLPDDTWKAVHYVGNTATNRELFSDGASVEAQTDNIAISGAYRMGIGVDANLSPAGATGANVAEVRFRKSALSDVYISTETNNHLTPGTFFTYIDPNASDVSPSPLQMLSSQYSPIAASRLNGVLQ